eukprot:s819_g2.t1
MGQSLINGWGHVNPNQQFDANAEFFRLLHPHLNLLCPRQKVEHQKVWHQRALDTPGTADDTPVSEEEEDPGVPWDHGNMQANAWYRTPADLAERRHQRPFKVDFQLLKGRRRDFSHTWGCSWG